MPQRFRILLPTRHTGFAPDLEFESTSRDWLEVRPGADGWRNGAVIGVPDIIFHSRLRVDDEKAYRIQSGCSLLEERGTPEPRSVALLLESPHKDEFDGRQGEAIGPLRNIQARKSLEHHLPRLLLALQGKLREPLEGGSVTLVNAVQYQASLQALMDDYEGQLRPGVRTPVWRRLFRSGGDRDLLKRLDDYQPLAVLLAPTGVVRNAVKRAIKGHRRKWRCFEIDSHPSYWGRRAPSLGGELK